MKLELSSSHLDFPSRSLCACIVDASTDTMETLNHRGGKQDFCLTTSLFLFVFVWFVALVLC